MVREAGHGVDLQEPRAAVIEHEVHACHVAAAHRMPCGAAEGADGLHDASRKFRVEHVLGVVAVVLRLVVVGAFAGADLDDRQALAVDQAHRQLASADEFLGEQAPAAELEFQPGAHHFLRRVADPQVDARAVVRRLDDHRAVEGELDPGLQLLRAWRGHSQFTDDPLGCHLVHGDAGGLRIAAHVRAAVRLEEFLQRSAFAPRAVEHREHHVAVHGADLVEAGTVDRDFVHFQAGAPQGGGHHRPGLQADFALRVGAALQEQDARSEQGAGVGCRHGSPPCECPAPFHGVGRCRGLTPRRGARRLPRARAERPCA